jgi:hypothetical protein
MARFEGEEETGEAAAAAALNEAASGGGGAADEGGKGGGKEGETGASGGQAVDLSQKVKLGDGTTVTVQELIDSRKAAEQASGQLGAASKALNNVQAIFDPNVPAEQKIEAVKSELNRQGYSDEAVDEYLTSVGLVGEGEQEESVSDEAVKKVALQQQEQSAEVLEMKKDMLRRQLNTSLDDAMKGDEVSNVLKMVERVQGKDAVKGAKDSIRKILEQNTLKGIQGRRVNSLTGEEQRVEFSWFDDEAEKAVKPTIEFLRTVIGDPNKLGRTPETDVEGIGAILNKKPVAAPKFDPQKDAGDIESEQKAFTEDALGRMAAETLLETGSV